MTVDWPLYEKLLGNGMYASKRDVIIDEAVKSFVTGMSDDPAYQEDARINDVTTPIIASRSSTIQCEIKAAPGTDIHIGDMVECLNETWIVVELYIDKIGIINGTMWLCNNIIRFQNRSATVISRYCVVDDGSYSKKSTDPDAFVSTNTYSVYITIDESTRRLYVDKRLAFGKIFSANDEEILEAYKIIGMDVKSKNFGKGSHLMVLTVQRDVYDARVDSLEDNLCDVFTPSNKDNPTITGSCIITGRNVIRIGVTRTYSATFLDINGDENQDVIADWNIKAPDSVKYSKNKNGITIKVPLDEKLVGECITINVTDSDGQFGTYEKKVQVVTVG